MDRFKQALWLVLSAQERCKDKPDCHKTCMKPRARGRGRLSESLFWLDSRFPTKQPVEGPRVVSGLGEQHAGPCGTVRGGLLHALWRDQNER